MRTLIAAFAFAACATGAYAQTTQTQTATPTTAAPTATTASGYNVEDTEIGTLLDDPAAKAVLDKHIPGFSANEQIDMARSMTLKMVQQYASDKVSDQALNAIQADLAKLPVKK